MAEMTTAVGYASSADVPLHFGLGAATVIAEDRDPLAERARSQTLTNVKADQVVAVRRASRPLSQRSRRRQTEP